jgi:DNA-directed RNA polymerase specialized sigma24 family protein
VAPLLPDRVLLDRLVRRDATALVELQRRHTGSLYALAYGILMDAVRAERVVAEAFERVWYAAEPLSRRRMGPAAWLRQQVKERSRSLRGAQTTAA